MTTPPRQGWWRAATSLKTLPPAWPAVAVLRWPRLAWGDERRPVTLNGHSPRAQDGGPTVYWRLLHASRQAPEVCSDGRRAVLRRAALAAASRATGPALSPD